MKKMKVNIFLISLPSVILGIVYFMLVTKTNLFNVYKNMFPYEPEFLWDILPILILNTMLGLMLGGNKRGILKKLF